MIGIDTINVDIAGIHSYYEDGQLILLATDIGNNK